MTTMEQLGKNAKEASFLLKNAGGQKDLALRQIADDLLAHTQEILDANQIDMENGKAAGVKAAFLDRLALNEKRISAMAEGARQVASFPDPIGQITEGHTHSNGMQISRVTVPLGVIGMIYEARPNVTVDAAVLCLKAGNAVILRGGKEAICTNQSLVKIMRQSLEKVSLSPNCIQLVEDTTRKSAEEMMNLTEYLDVLIPRGGAGLIQAVVKNAHVPVIETGAGNCHIYIDRSADLDMAARVIFNAKTSRPSVCNACEKVLVHRAIAEQALPKVKALLDTKQVELRGCPEVCRILGKDIIPASEEDWSTEYNDYILGICVVDSIEQAIAHITKYSTGHSEAILTQDYAAAELFTRVIDSAAVYVNASTRFTDGGEFGLGAEIGISTQKLHARGPMGIKQLTSEKYIIRGSGQIR